MYGTFQKLSTKSLNLENEKKKKNHHELLS